MGRDNKSFIVRMIIICIISIFNLTSIFKYKEVIRGLFEARNTDLFFGTLKEDFSGRDKSTLTSQQGDIILIALIVSIVISIAIITHLIIVKSSSEYKIKKRAFYEVLTGEKNSLKFRIQSEKRLKNRKNNLYQLIYISIDKFKILNDIFGYKYGDSLLIYISRKIKSSINKDELFCRGCGDEFFILMKYVDNENTIERIARLDKSIHLFESGNQKISRFTVGYGVYIIQNDNIEINKAIDNAELARKCIKERYDKNIAFYDESMKKVELEEKEFEDRMDYALNNNEFEIYLQAKYSISLGKPIGAEALVRWNTPDRGLISPFKFIPIFEKNGFILNLDMYVFEKVCSKISEWNDEGLTVIAVSVNMSRIHMKDVDCFIGEISNIFNKYNISSQLIEIEITESALFEDADAIIEAMIRLKELGFGVSLDDFGSAYSSLNILKDLPVDTIKLDREFLDINHGNGKSEIIISNIVKMAKDLNLVVVAEGVETLEQAMFLNKIGYNIAQGYLYSKPMPINIFEEKELKKVKIISN